MADNYSMKMRLLDKIDLTGDEPVIQTEVIHESIPVVELDDYQNIGSSKSDSENICPAKKSKASKQKCEICLDEESKYTCPGCEMKTCSLDCVLKHKQLRGCSGQRNKTSFVARTDFSNIHLLNDYRLLEEAGRIADNARRDYKSKKGLHISKRNKILQKGARAVGVNLFRMENGMKRKRENRSYFNISENMMRWTTKFVFDDINKEKIESYDDSSVVEEIISIYIDKDKVLPENKIEFDSYIHRVNGEDISVFFRNEFDPGDNSRYTLVDHKKTLREILEKKSVLEYPEFHVTLPKTSDRLELEQFVKRNGDIEVMRQNAENISDNVNTSIAPLATWLSK